MYCVYLVFPGVAITFGKQSTVCMMSWASLDAEKCSLVGDTVANEWRFLSANSTLAAVSVLAPVAALVAHSSLSGSSDGLKSRRSEVASEKLSRQSASSSSLAL